MTHYDTLGCKPDATPDELKSAARRAASAAHPDREGGSDAAMAKVNQAREVLLDPERRAHYDATGEDRTGPSLMDKATQLLVDIFSEAIEREGHIVNYVRAGLKDMLANADREKADTKTKITRLEKRRGKVKVKTGDNLVDMLITGQLDRHNAMLKSIESAAAMATRALELLDAYEEPDEGPAFATARPTVSPDIALMQAIFGRGFR
ncbi:hypothetical protein RD110_15845 [Rhodoferax koreense]|uniref:J domain-containing protein n=1 Tax=Rhodoferax koreensis TaxID=1842727 RepID=A0A1P8JXK4_9BURK|nr:DnaJ domain-containing protein [Rhodoferax koreense]APW38494.1 hypothetical protein RD110_15845 [Rhodoferax koreense]